MERKIEAGELQVVLASEECQVRNVTMILGHSNETRKIVRQLEERIKKLETTISSQNQVIQNLQVQLAGIHAKLARGGTTVV